MILFGLVWSSDPYWLFFGLGCFGWVCSEVVIIWLGLVWFGLCDIQCLLLVIGIYGYTVYITYLSKVKNEGENKIKK